MAAEHAARKALVDHEIDVTGLVLNVAFDHDGEPFVASSAVPRPPAVFLAASLHESAVQAGWTPIDLIGGDR